MVETVFNKPTTDTRPAVSTGNEMPLSSELPAAPTWSEGRTPSVRYVTTEDGYNIAYTDSGRGRPFILLPPWTNHVQEVWTSTLGFFWHGLSDRFRLINYDARGLGMSTRGLGDDLTLDSYLLDLDAVLEQLDIQRFVLMGSHGSALLAGHYAVRHPERVEALILSNTGVCWQGADIPSLWLDLPRQSWDAFLYSLIPKSVGDEVVEQVVQSLKRWVSQTDYLASTNVWRSAGLEDVLDSLHTPTLVLKPQHCPCSRVEAAMEIASRLPNSQLFLMDSDRIFGAPGQAIGAIESFLAEVDENRSARDEGQGGERSRSSVAPSCLTSREVEVLRLIAEGLSNREIAEELVLSLRTVERHITNVYAKIGARGRADATSYALHNSLT